MMNLISIKRAVTAAVVCSVTLTSQAEVVVVVGSRSPVTSLTKAQISDLYLGRTKDFPSGGGTALTAMIASGPAKDDFFEKVLSKTDSQARSIWARLVFTGIGTGPKELGDAHQMKKLLATNPNVIGFLDKADVDGQVKVVYSP